MWRRSLRVFAPLCEASVVLNSRRLGPGYSHSEPVPTIHARARHVFLLQVAVGWGGVGSECQAQIPPRFRSASTKPNGALNRSRWYCRHKHQLGSLLILTSKVLGMCHFEVFLLQGFDASYIFIYSWLNSTNTPFFLAFCAYWSYCLCSRPVQTLSGWSRTNASF